MSSETSPEVKVYAWSVKGVAAAERPVWSMHTLAHENAHGIREGGGYGRPWADYLG